MAILLDVSDSDIALAAGTKINGWTICGTPKGPRYPCQCDCGRISAVTLHDLLAGRSKTCRYCANDGSKNPNWRHGFLENGKQPKLYMVWSAMKRRCRNPNTKDWKDYGARGIRVCEAWFDYRTFRAWATSHGYAEGLTLERVDNDGNYEPGNCTWIPRAAQARNRRSRGR